MSILVVGGAGYIGSHAARWLAQAGRDVWVYDNLSRGCRQAAPAGRLIEGELSDRARLAAVMREKGVDAVMHFAALAYVGESVEHPALYYENNVRGSLSLLEAMREAGVWRIVFSSTTATYGIPDVSPITEDTPQQPINPYGFTKLVVERALQDYADAYGFGFAALRYFNAAGAAPDGALGEDKNPHTRIIPIVLEVALGLRDEVVIYGDDYSTPDGTCIRDYIHVDDLADAHLKALDRIERGSADYLNLGIGKGYSVLEVVEACRRATGAEIPYRVGARRAGDPPELVADSRRAQSVLDWRPRFDTIDAIVETAWNWHRHHPHGYAGGDDSS